MADLRLHNSQRTAVMDSTFGIALSPWTAELGLGAKKAPSRDDHRSTNIHVIISSIEHLLPNMGALRWDTPGAPHWLLKHHRTLCGPRYHFQLSVIPFDKTTPSRS
jgi:hypothetical protein